MGAKKCVVEVISTTVIKPSSPTPESKRRVKLSLVDQRVPRIYAPMIYCYNTPTLTTFAIQQSLSKTLELFYPFAGQLSHDFTSIECTDHGAYCLEATTDSRLSDFLRNPDHKAVGRLIPSSDPKTMREATRNNVVTLVQLTGFSCGGIAIGVEVSHKIADGFSVACFSKAWAAISAGIRDVAPPAFSSSDLLHSPDSHVFPIKRIDPAPLQVPLRSRMFTFSSAKLAVLKEEIKQKGQVNFRPSTLEAVSSLLFRCIAEAAGASALLQMVDMRTRLTSPPVNCIGNISWPLFVYSGENKRSMELHEIAGIIRKELSAFFSDCREDRLIKGDALVSMVSNFLAQEAELAMAGVGLKWVSFLSSFRLYETDFGWGEPAWVTCPLFFPNCFQMMHSKSGNEIEVWATLEEHVMAKFESNEQLLAFAYLDVNIE